MEPNDILRTLLGRWRMIAAAAVAAAAVATGVIVTTGAEPERVHVSSATIALSDGARAIGTKLDPFAVLTTEGPVRERAAATLGELPTQELARRLQIRVDNESGALTITARHLDPNIAHATAAAFASALLEEVASRDGDQHARDVDDAAVRLEGIEAEVEMLDRRIARTSGTERDLLRARRDALIRQASFAYEAYQALASRGPSQRLELLRVGEPEPDGSSLLAPSGVIPRVALALGFGLVLGVIGALVVERLDTRVRSRRQAEAAFGLPVLAEVRARRKRLDTIDAPASREAAGYRLVREAFSTNGFRRNGSAVSRARAVLVTSPTADRRTAEVAANLAAAFGETGRATTLVSADLRRPRLHGLVGAPEAPGLIQVIEGGGADASTHATSVPGVRAVPSGGTVANPAGVLSSDAARAAIESLRASADALVLAAPGLLDASDPAPLLPQVDGVVVVARAGGTTQAAARRTGELLRRAEVHVAGVVLVEGSRR